MLDSLQDFAASFPEVLQWFGVMVIAAVPFVESYVGSLVGVLIGLPPAVAIAAAVVGNIISMLCFVMSAHGVRSTVKSRRRSRAAARAAGNSAAGSAGSSTGGGAVAVAERAELIEQPEDESPRRQKLRRAFDRYGVAGVSLLGQTILPSQITSAAMVSFGANRNAVIFWQVISITIWGTVVGVLASLGVSLSR